MSGFTKGPWHVDGAMIARVGSQNSIAVVGGFDSFGDFSQYPSWQDNPT